MCSINEDSREKVTGQDFSGTRYIPGMLIRVVIPLMIILLMKIDKTTPVGMLPQNARKLKIKLSMGMLRALLTKTLAH